MHKFITYAILIVNCLLIEANEYCTLEQLLCQGRIHVGCSKRLPKSTGVEIVELTPNFHQRILHDLNKFRNDFALGLRKEGTSGATISNMKMLQWNHELELLAENASLNLEYHNGMDNLCYATSEFPQPILITTNDPSGVVAENEFNADPVVTLTGKLIRQYETNSVLSNPESYEVGCSVRQMNKVHSLTCLLYGYVNTNLFEYGKPCTNCKSLQCDSTFQGLCAPSTGSVLMLGAQQDQNAQNETATGNNFEIGNVHIIAVYVLLGGLVVLIVLMLVLIKYLCQYNSHISI